MYPLNIFTIDIIQQVKGPNGETLTNEQTVEMVAEQIEYIYKPPLETIQQLVMGFPVPLLSKSVIPTDILEAAGLVKATSAEGPECWLNPSKVKFFMSPELGTYLLFFTGGAQLGLRITGAELKTLLGIGSLIV